MQQTSILKNLIVFSLLFALAVRPVFYLGQWTYYATNLDKIIDEYCVNKDRPQLQCDGKCYLAQQMMLAEVNYDKEQLQVGALVAFYPVYYQQNNIDFNFSKAFYYKQELIVSKEQLLLSSYKHDLFKPPIV